jgi:HK97 family phage major capsid protein
VSTIGELRTQITERLTRARDLADLADQEGRDFSESERAQISGLMTEARDLKARLTVAEGDNDLRNQLAGLGVGLIDSQGGTVTPKPTPVMVAATQARPQTLGQHYLESPEYRDFMATYARGGSIPDSAKGIQSRPAFFNDLLTGASPTSGGALVVPDQTGILVDPLRQPLVLRGMVTNGSTMSDSVEFVRVTSETNTAAPVAEATATAGVSGTKPESAMTLERVSESVKTIAHWIPATKRALSDAGQLRTLIDSFLRYGLEAELDDQMVNGDGIGENFTGILATANVQTQAWDTDLLTTTRKGRTLVRTVGRDTPNAYLLNPADWELIDLLKDNEARYYFGGPMQLGTPRLWGLPVIESEAIAVGTGLVANFRQAVLWDREEASIMVSDSHADFFIRNLLAILGELRAAFGILRPRSFVILDLTAV